MPVIHPEFGQLMTAEEYAQEWEGNASHFERNGYYAMPLERLGQPGTVMEIGCGSGRSTLALARKGHTVIAAEINEPAARMAQGHLSAHGIETKLSHSFPSLASGAPDLPQVTIVVGDVHAQGALEPLGDSRLDAVLCWFIGAQLDVIAEYFGKPVTRLSSEDVRNYRLSLQARCYDIGRRVLHKGGIVQVVDRMRLVSWSQEADTREALAQMQAEIAGEGYDLSSDSIHLSRVSDGFEGSAIQYLTERPDARVRVVSSVMATLG